MEQSSEAFKNHSDEYIHRGEWKFDTGLEMNMLQKYFYIPIDICLSIVDNKIDKGALSELEAWIYFIGSDKPNNMEKIIREYPKFAKMYEEINIFRKNPKESVGMFSEALRILDENTVKLMIEQQKEEIARVEAELADKNAELADKNAELADKNAELADKDVQIEELLKELEHYRKITEL